MWDSQSLSRTMTGSATCSMTSTISLSMIKTSTRVLRGLAISQLQFRSGVLSKCSFLVRVRFSVSVTINFTVNNNVFLFRYEHTHVRVRSLITGRGVAEKWEKSPEHFVPPTPPTIMAKIFPAPLFVGVKLDLSPYYFVAAPAPPPPPLPRK